MVGAGEGLRVCEGLEPGRGFAGELGMQVLWSVRWELCYILAFLFCEDEEALRTALHSFPMNSGLVVFPEVCDAQRG
jgi:hypothetical protein